MKDRGTEEEPETYCVLSLMMLRQAQVLLAVILIVNVVNLTLFGLSDRFKVGEPARSLFNRLYYTKYQVINWKECLKGETTW